MDTCVSLLIVTRPFTIFHLVFFTKITHIFFPFLKINFKKNFITENLQIISEPKIMYNFINDFIMFIESKFHVLMFSCLSVSVGEEKRKMWLLLNLRKPV